MKDEDAAAAANRLTCYTREVTAGVTAETAIRDLDALAIPPAMQDLVDETKGALQTVVDADLETACGEAMSEPKESKQCDLALGSRAMSYELLTAALDKWAPYL